jgi:hypothetical protein
MDKGIAAAESSAERLALLRRRDSETESSGGTHVAPSERWRSGWDHEFESPLLQQPVCLSGEPRGCMRKAPHFGAGLRMAGDMRRDVEAANQDSFALSLWRALMQSHLC